MNHFKIKKLLIISLLFISIFSLISCMDNNKNTIQENNNTWASVIASWSTNTKLNKIINFEQARVQKAIKSLNEEELKLIEELKLAQKNNDIIKIKEIKDKFKDLIAKEIGKKQEAQKAWNKELEKKHKIRQLDLSVFTK